MINKSFTLFFMLSFLIALISCQKEDDNNYSLIPFAGIVGKYKGSSVVCTAFVSTQDTICTSAIDNSLQVIVLNNQKIITYDEAEIFGRDTLTLIKTERINGARQFYFAHQTSNLSYQETGRLVTLENKVTNDNNTVFDIFKGSK